LNGEAEIRAAGPHDLERVAELERLCFDPPWPRPALAEEIARPTSLLLVAAPGPAAPAAGYALFRHAGGEAELFRLGVLAEQRRQGLGDRLLHHGLERLARLGIERCHLEVRVDNQPAIALYERAGFAQVGRRPAYYRDGTDAFLYSRGIAP
jgi:ribosomal-protein-alanine N-acetyltransferase